MKKKFLSSIIKLFVLILFVLSGCNEDDSGLASYAGSPEMSNIQVEQGSYEPKITWLGGYASVLGVNRDTSSALDSTLIWLIQIDGNNLKFPVRFGELPEGAVDITEQFGGTKASNLSEDHTYTYWVIKGNVWSQISNQAGKKIIVDNSLGNSSPVIIGEDSIKVSNENAVIKTQSIDVYVNVTNVLSYGRLGELFVSPTDTSNSVEVSWEIRQTGVTNSSISAIGLVEGQQYQPIFSLWEVWSEDIIEGGSEFGKSDIISSPVVLGQQFPGTRIFEEFPVEGLERNKDYLVWIGNSSWDQRGRSRTTNYYAWVTFRTW